MTNLANFTVLNFGQDQLYIMQPSSSGIFAKRSLTKLGSSKKLITQLLILHQWVQVLMVKLARNGWIFCSVLLSTYKVLKHGSPALAGSNSEQGHNYSKDVRPKCTLLVMTSVCKMESLSPFREWDLIVTLPGQWPKANRDRPVGYYRTL